MELELSLGDSRAPPKGNLPALAHIHTGERGGHEVMLELGVGTAKRAEQDNQKTPMRPEEDVQEEYEAGSHSEAPVELSLGCPLLPASAETGSVNSEVCRRGFVVNAVLMDGDTAQGRSNLLTSSLPEEVPVQQAADQEAAEDEENSGSGGGVRKKLRLSKEQSAFLEDSFKEHSTLNPKQKSDLAKRLNLRPRQVEVWFQNRRARTKLKQTEVDCKYLKRCCETLAQENRRLQREVAELRAMRSTTAYPLYGFMSTARVCPSCDNKVVTAHHSPAITTPSAVAASASPSPVPTPSLFARPHFVPFTVHPVLRRQPSATS
ncbi:hypothetical protein U9M48_023068 [Paspalum notatum var. saurae]|uniref:Homeobox domain-containing protein n=1 Tax=Paspalum notatum var. saurae TaxID=547442 RepID=A0AAQ3TJU0_PASNO